MYKLFFKRFCDLIISLLILILLFPLLILIVLLIKIDSKGPIFFIQERVGKNLSLFNILKFRTMTHEKREVKDIPIIGKGVGVTNIGYILRRLKIDELPQLINVLKGEMSLVGPRPSIEKQLNNMTESEKRRYYVDPGLTGLAQVSGNIHLSWKERYVFDVEYVDNISLKNDFIILIRTFFVIFVGEDKFLNNPIRFKNKNENS